MAGGSEQEEELDTCGEFTTILTILGFGTLAADERLPGIKPAVRVSLSWVLRAP